MIAYLDTSAALRALTDSPQAPEARTLARELIDSTLAHGHGIIASRLLEVELLCQANRQPELDPAGISEFLRVVDLVDLEPVDVRQAPTTPGRLRTLDAIHLTVALKLGAGLMIAFDRELRRAAAEAGMRVGPDLAE